MLLRSLDLLFNDPQTFFAVIPLLLLLVGLALLFGITVHEFSHALVANALGDNTARRLGRLTLNPIAHLDPIGTFLLFLVGFGWGKPVPVNEFRLRQGRFSMALVAVAGPLSNFLTAWALSVPIKLELVDWRSPFTFTGRITSAEEFLALFLGFGIFFNLILGIFNLLPLSPLDGSKVIRGLVPYPATRLLRRIEALGPVLLIGLIAIDFLTGFGILGRIIGPVVNWFSTILIDRSIFMT
jgi:Zn-dependent protease